MEFAAVEILKAASGFSLQDERNLLSIHNSIIVTKENVISAINDGFTITSLKTFQQAITSSVNLNSSIGSIDTSDSSMDYICLPDLKSINISPCEKYLLATTTFFLFIFHLETIKHKVSKKINKTKRKQKQK